MDIIAVIALIVGAAGGVYLGRSLFSKGSGISRALEQEISEKERRLHDLKSKLSEGEAKIRSEEAQAKAAAKEILADAKLQARELTGKIEKDQVRLEEKERGLDERVHELEHQRTNLEKAQSNMKELENELLLAQTAHRQALERVAKLSTEEAKEKLAHELEEEFSAFFAKRIKLKEQELEQSYEERARDLITQAIQRFASEVASESTTTAVQIPSDDVKGKIIGKEGRNINAFEQATGVDVIIDDTPGIIVLSGFDLARRYVAKLAMEKLIQDGRIQPARIEEVVGKMKEQVGKMIL